MFFEEPNLDVEILSVLELSWNESHAYARPRSFNALSYRISGGAEFTHNGICKTVKAGEIAYVPADFDYTINAESEHLFVIHFNLKNYTGTDMEVISPENSKYFETKFHNMYTSWSKKQFGYQYECKCELYKILLKLFRQKHEQRINHKYDKMNEIAEYIHEHFTDKDLTVDFLAKTANMSDTYFRKLFVSSFSETPLRYINSLRVSYALELMRSGYYSVEEAAEKSGFDNQKYLSAVIKKYTGHSPYEFKKQPFLNDFKDSRTDFTAL